MAINFLSAPQWGQTAPGEYDGVAGSLLENE
jgi:hypothetical protein